MAGPKQVMKVGLTVTHKKRTDLIINFHFLSENHI